MLYSNKDLKKLIIPLVFEQLLALLVGLADTLMISGVSEAAVSGVSLVDTINILLINIFASFATGGAVIAGHYLGKNNRDNACKAGWQILLFSIVSSFLITSLFLAFHNGILQLIIGRVEADVMENAKAYLVVTAVSFVPLAVYNAYDRGYCFYVDISVGFCLSAGNLHGPWVDGRLDCHDHRLGVPLHLFCCTI